MKAAILTSIAALFLVTGAAYAQDTEPEPARFRPSQQIWQCNDIRVTVTNPSPGVVNYDIGGTIWGGINFTAVYSIGPDGGLFLRGMPCARLR
jgi:hypothetical protein